ncbi:M3 family metallopeptidase [Demequina muriae]|uniref:M3 family metallopeptidase n=1 Tax=Demequina muriae TaxID=3051664 RepID=A0ABT8GIX2_9MICO|nr:M3 family metallopeptidase [Demequina sp. EGI L300058]MDN4481382.1 M3 family metallopeptidase [Demequina sp. EGI L300058]
MSRAPSFVTFPAADSDWTTFVENYVSERLNTARARLGTLTAGDADGAPTAEEALTAWNDADIALTHAHQLMESISEVHPDREVRVRCTDLQQRTQRFRTARDGDPALYSAMSGALSGAALEGDDAYARDLILADFRLAGAHLGADQRDRLAQLDDALSSAATEFSENIREDTRSIRVAPSSLAGLPDDYVAAHPAGEDGLIEITTDYPDLGPFLDMSTDADAREALMRADYQRAYPVNDEVLSRLLRLRDEKARLLGFGGWADYATARMMMTDGAGIDAFLTGVEAAARPAGEADAAMLLERKRRDVPDATSLLVSDSRFYIETLKAERFGVDAREVRRYLDYQRVRDGILALTAELFGVSFSPVFDAPSWHDDVQAFDVVDAGDTIGRIYLDMHPRPGKYGHMACFPLVTGIGGQHLPEAALVCNFPRGRMTFDDLETYLHEFGHLLHVVFSGGVRHSRLAGLSEQGEWDFVEAPSQLLEEWAWTHEVLARFAIDDDGEPIPATLVEALRASRDLGAGLTTCRQLVYAQLSYRLHRDVPEDLASASAAIERELDVRTPLEGTHQYASFGHLTTYSACYYTYQWSLSIAKDLFTGFDPEHLLDQTRSRRYRDAVLAPGGSRPAARLIEDFLGRPFSTRAYEEWLASLATS